MNYPTLSAQLSQFALASLLCVILPGHELAAQSDVPQNPIPQSLAQQLEDALAETTTDAQSRLELVSQIDQLLSASAGAPNHASNLALGEFQAKVRFVEALANMRLNRLDLSATQIADLRGKVDARLFPEMAFRCQSLQAAIMLLQGKKTEGLAALEELLATDLSQVPASLITRARINYAVALYDCGRLDEAIETYQSIMLGAIEHGNDSTALQAGNNMIQILLLGENVHAARQAINELKPVMDRNSKTLGTQSLQLRELDVLRLEGHIAEAIAGYEKFIHRSEPQPPLIEGTAHKLLAQALAANGQLDDAITHAQKSVSLLSHMANEVAARLSLAELLVRKQDFARALQELDMIDPAVEPAPATQKRIYYVRLLAQLERDGRRAEADLLSGFVKAANAQDKQLSKIIADDFERRLGVVRQTLAAQKQAAIEQAGQESRRAERYLKYLLSGLLAAGATSCGIAIVVNLRRRAERLKLAEQTAQNARLEALVDSKTRELTANLVAQAEMAQALERKKRVETIGLLAGNVAHDINNLLQVIANANETLASPDADDQLRSQALRVSEESLQHGSGIIRQILAYSRQQEFSARPVRVGEYLSSSRALFHSAVGSTVVLDLDDQSQGSHILIDPSHLTTAILNLLSNAADAMPAGGKVLIKAEPIELRAGETAEWQSSKPGEYVLLRIRDSGLGMNAETLSRALEPFYSTKSVGEGTGLGLSSVYGFVKQSGGDMRLQSQPGAGTEVQLLFPKTVEPIVAPVGPPPNSLEPYANKRLLLVEDHHAVARSLMLLLKHLKLRAHWVASGDEAAAALKLDSNYDFVLSDVHMPGTLDGLALAKWIRANYPKIYVLLMSGYNDLPLGQIDVPLLQKPFKLTELSSLLGQKVSPSPQGT